MRSMYRCFAFLLMAAASAGIFLSCNDDDGGEPLIRYVRITAPESSDSLLAAAGQGQMIAIIGQNLGQVKQLFINDQPAVLTPTLITNTSVITRVPEDLPLVVSNKMTLYFSNGKMLEYPFELAVSKPVVAGMACEFVADGDVAIIVGNYFYPPLTVTFTGGVQGEVVQVADEAIAVVVPEGAQPGPITVKTNFGEATSTFHFRDTRVFLNYDDLNANGSWRPGATATEGGLDGNYLLLKGKLGPNDRKEDYEGNVGYVSEFWAKVNGRPEGNLLPGKPEDYVMKFEIDVIEWYGSYLNICFAPWDHSNSNQEYWSNLNARAYWGPWDATDASITTGGWVTAVIPMTDFAYQMGTPNGVVTYTSMPFNPAITGSLTFWLVGSPKAKSTPVELHIDNVRIVPR